MKPKNNVKLDNYDGILLCPGCGKTNLHHAKIEVWNQHEDDTTGQHITISQGSTREDKDVSGNPSPRRHGLSISFFCEHCSCDGKGNRNDKVFVLDEIQHKGSTYLAWKGDDEGGR